MKTLRIAMLAAVAVAAKPAMADAAPASPSIPWKMPSYTLVARDMDLRVALDTFAVAEGLSVVMSPTVAGRFSGHFKNVPPGEFLDRIATTHNLMWYYDGAALYVYGAGEISTMLVDLKYMKAGEVRQMLADLGVEDSRFPLKTASNDELVMVSGPPRYVSLVAEMIAKADSLRENRTFNEVEARVFPLSYTWADDISFKASGAESSLQLRGVARMLEDIMNSSSGGATTHEAVLTNDVSRLETAKTSAYRPVIRPDNRLNAVIVRDVSSRMPMYEKLIKQLDTPQKLIEIEVTVLELTKKNALDWQLSLSANASHGHSDFGAGQNAANIFSPENIAGKGFAGAMTHVHSAYAIASSITALREKGKAKSISRTSLLTVNNLAAEMSDSQSYHAKVVGTEVATLQEVTAGTRLQVKPRILPSAVTNKPDKVWLSLELDDGGFEAITVDAMPMKRSSTLTTQTALSIDESIMLAGYLRDIEEDAGWGIPYLRDIPWIGWLFGGKSTRKESVQRIFVVSPHIVELDEEMLARLQATKLRDLEEAEQLRDDAEKSEKEREEKAKEEEKKAREEEKKEKEKDTPAKES